MPRVRFLDLVLDGRGGYAAAVMLEGGEGPLEMRASEPFARPEDERDRLMREICDEMREIGSLGDCGEEPDPEKRRP